MMIEIPIKYKKYISKSYSYFNDNTAYLIDRIFQMLDLKILSLLIFLAAITLGITYIWVQNSSQTVIFTPEQIAYLTLPDTRIQSKFYTLFSITIFGFFITAGLFAPSWFQRRNKPQWQTSLAIPDWLRPGLAIVFWTVIIFIYKTHGSSFIQTSVKGRDFLLALATAYLMKETIKGRFSTRTIAIALLSVILIIYILPLGLMHEVADTRLFSMDLHWSAVIGDGLYKDSLAGMEFSAFSNYGVLLNELVANSRLIPLFETLGGTVTFLKFINLVFSGLVVVIIFQRLGMKNKRMVWATTLLILFVFSGRISGVAETFDAPNQLPIRILMVPITVILAYLLAGRSWCSGSVIFGLISPVLVFYNFETSFYCILAMGFAIFIESARKGVLSVIMSGAAFTLSFLLSGVILTLALFDGSLSTILAKLTQLVELKVQSGTSGFAGLPVYFFPPFLWIMIHAFVLFSQYLLSVRDRSRLSPLEFQNIVIIGIIIAIGPYVMNRFSIQNMLVPFLLYTLLVLPKLTMGPRADRTFWSFVLIVLIIPFIFGNPVKRIWSKGLVTHVSDKFHDRLAPCLDGITASDKLCDYTLEKADELKRLASENPSLEWISELSLNMIRLTGTQPVFTQKAPFFFAHSMERREILVASLRELQASVIALDYNPIYPGNVAGIHPATQEFERNLVQDAGYQIIGKTKYWLIARKQDDNYARSIHSPLR